MVRIPDPQDTNTCSLNLQGKRQGAPSPENEKEFK